jgi:hypothetical protein
VHAVRKHRLSPEGHAGCSAAGIESIDVNIPSISNIGKAISDKNQSVLQEAEDSFQNSELLQKLKAQSAENKDKCALACNVCVDSVALLAITTKIALLCKRVCAASSDALNVSPCTHGGDGELAVPTAECQDI